MTIKNKSQSERLQESMEDITSNITQLRAASAKAVVKVSHPDTILAVIENRVPKGNVFEMAKVAGLFAVKNTFLNLPNPIEFTGIDFRIRDLEIEISVEVKSICKSSLEMEALHGASIVALTIYDMLKPIDKGISIEHLKTAENPEKPSNESIGKKSINAAVVVCSNTVSNGLKQDSAGQVILEKLRANGCRITSYVILPDIFEEIREKAISLSQTNQLVVFCGGTGLAKTDVTPEALETLLERRIPGIEEAMRSYGQRQTPHAMFSRSLAGMIRDCMVLALPGSTRGAMESMEAVFPDFLHVFPISKDS